MQVYPGRADAHRRAVRLEWISIAYLLTAITAIYFTLGSSQAMRGAWLEDLLSLAPPIAFLVAARIRYKRPNGRFHSQSDQFNGVVDNVSLRIKEKP